MSHKLVACSRLGFLLVAHMNTPAVLLLHCSGYPLILFPWPDPSLDQVKVRVTLALYLHQGQGRYTLSLPVPTVALCYGARHTYKWNEHFNRQIMVMKLYAVHSTVQYVHMGILEEGERGGALLVPAMPVCLDKPTCNAHSQAFVNLFLLSLPSPSHACSPSHRWPDSTHTSSILNHISFQMQAFLYFSGFVTVWQYFLRET